MVLLVPCYFVRIYTFEKQPSLPVFRLALYGEKPLPISRAINYGGLSNLSCGCTFSGPMCVNSQFREVLLAFFFQELVISCSLWCPSTVLQVLWRGYKMPSSFLFSVDLRHLEYGGSHQCSELDKRETSPLKSSPLPLKS